MEDKEALKEILSLFTEKEIPCWLDCGTCLGAYRHGGIIPWDNDIDVEVLENDFDNVMHALQGLDKTKYAAQDWSSRALPRTYIRVYIKSTRNHIDIFFAAIDAENQMLTTIFSNEGSNFMPEKWKIREKTLCKPLPFDVVFPLKKGNFDGIEVPVPNQTRTYLNYKYGPNIEPARIYNAETDSYEKDLSHPYWEIPLTH